MLAVVALLSACEPISLPALDKPGGTGAVDAGTDVPEDGGDDGGSPDGGPVAPADGGPVESPDAGSDGGDVREDAGSGALEDAGSGTPEDAGGNGQMTPWSACEDGWQSRTVRPRGGWASPNFALDSDGDAYFVDYTDNVIRVSTTKPGRVVEGTGWVGLPWVGGVRVDAQGEIHLAMSAVANGSEPMSISFLRYTEGRWERTSTPSGQVKDFDMDAQGNLHALSVVEANGLYFNHVHGRPGALVVDNTGLEVGDLYRTSLLRADAQGHAHVVYERSTNPKGLYYATNATGVWVKELLSATGKEPTIAVTPSGVPHVLFTEEGQLALGIRRTPGDWSTSLLQAWGVGYSSIAVDSSGGVHVLHPGGLQRQVNYWNNGSGSWVMKTIASYEEASMPVLDMSVQVDARGRVHAMYYLVLPDLETGAMARTLDYARQCP
ncbi:hypothetical protein ACN469_38270 [Corallococcus terminator]